MRDTMRNLLASLLLVSSSLLAQATEVRVQGGGNGCGPTLQGTATITGSRVDVNLTLTSGFSNEFAFFVLGLQQIQIGIPFYGCRLYLEPLVTATLPTNAAGRATLPLVASTAFLGTVYAQGATFRLQPNELFASNALEIRFRN